MIQSNHKLLGALLLVAAIGAGCHRTESDNPVVRPPVDYALQPIDLVLKFEQNDEDRALFTAPQLQSDERGENQSFYVTSGVTTKMVDGDDYACANFNIFLFHKTRDTIVRHYYVPEYMPKITLSNLYVGDYRLYVVVNNGPIGECNHPDHRGCTYRHTDMSDLMSSIIPLPQKSNDRYYGLMVYSDTAFRILHEKQELKVKLKRLTSKISLNFINHLPEGGGVDEYITLKDYSILNMPRRAKLFGDYRPTWRDVGQVTSYPITNTKFIVLNNLQGDGLAVGSVDPRDRNSFKAPESATCVRLYATHTRDNITFSNISYLIYVGGQGINNYDMQAGKEYVYNIHLDTLNLNDYRVTSFTVPDEKEKFKNQIGSNLNFAAGEDISRPLTVEYSKLFASDILYISCFNTYDPVITKYKYKIYATVGGIEKLIHDGEEGAQLRRIPVPTTDVGSSMHRADMRIEYTQSEASKWTTLTLMLETANGQQHDVLPTQKVVYK